MARPLPLPVRRSMNLTEDAYTRLRGLSARYGLGNNYLLVVLLEQLDQFADPDKLDAAFRDFIAIYGAPTSGEKGKTDD
ncbi:hypothetical protein LGT41_0008625 [Abyssibius alkaniclasticus]|uniref:hypothetical protein n=1 Tax=Abyssibius alkaniclasticus TaxID=2881234 RepID=UPI002363926E|nr:hypothetical protein [Abyssibius alkaniclasticus]UPH69886.1 hypothetical protein LGT41_0008625 [Abyssibius alkaniclasticus]